MEISKAIIPVAGLGTRLLPTTKAIPKEMLPVGRYPIIQHVVEELINAGIRQTLFISSRTKNAIENHFDDYSELMIHLELDRHEMREVSHFDYRKRGVEFFFTRQQVPLGQTKPLGTGDAVAAAENFVDGAHFVVAFGDSIIPEIFAAIRSVPPAPNGEIYLTDAILDLIRNGHMVRAVQLAPSETRADIGNHQAYFETFIDYAIDDAECGPKVLDYLRQKLAEKEEK